MARAIYTQTIIAVIWDFDRTLIPGYSQAPVFRAYGVDEATFWNEVRALKDLYASRNLRVGDDTAYLLHMLSYVREGVFAGLTNSRLRELGAEIEMCPGIPAFFEDVGRMVTTDSEFAKHDISLEHYIVSTGIRPLIEGSQVGPFAKTIWANEFVDQPPKPDYLEHGHRFEGEGEIAQVGYMIDNTSKTRAVFEINKGPDVEVNTRIAPEDRRVPIPNMIYVADGPSDVPVFSVVMQYGGRCLGVYQTGDKPNFDKVKQLEDDGRVNSIAEANFNPGTQAYLWLTHTIREIAARICEDRVRRFQTMRPPPGHVT